MAVVARGGLGEGPTGATKLRCRDLTDEKTAALIHLAPISWKPSPACKPRRSISIRRLHNPASNIAHCVSMVTCLFHYTGAQRSGTIEFVLCFASNVQDRFLFFFCCCAYQTVNAHWFAYTGQLPIDEMDLLQARFKHNNLDITYGFNGSNWIIRSRIRGWLLIHYVEGCVEIVVIIPPGMIQKHSARKAALLNIILWVEETDYKKETALKDDMGVPDKKGTPVGSSPPRWSGYGRYK